MAGEIFADTSGFYALLVSRDDRRAEAVRVLREAGRRKRPFVTTDHVVAETANLLKARGLGHLLGPFFDRLTSPACRIEWTDAGRFGEVQSFCLKHADQAWSFTDCLSFLVMKRNRIRDALTKDKLFRQAGFVVLLE